MTHSMPSKADTDLYRFQIKHWWFAVGQFQRQDAQRPDVSLCVVGLAHDGCDVTESVSGRNH